MSTFYVVLGFLGIARSIGKPFLLLVLYFTLLLSFKRTSELDKHFHSVVYVVYKLWPNGQTKWQYSWTGKVWREEDLFRLCLGFISVIFIGPDQANAFLKASTKTELNIFHPTSVFVLISPVHTTPFSFVNGLFDAFSPIVRTKARFRRRSSHEPNRIRI